jgi:Glyoxal oxidase N-terminus
VIVAPGSLNGLVITDSANSNPTYEILDANAITTERHVTMDIFAKNQPYYLYPFIHLLRDGLLFVFPSNSSQMFHVNDDRIVKEVQDLLGMYRTDPDFGVGEMFPLTSQASHTTNVIICGGRAYVEVTSLTEAPYGRIQPESDTPTWEMDAVLEGRVKVEGVLLPGGIVL